MALPGRVPGGRIGNRLGDADARGQLPARGRAAQGRSSVARGAGRKAGEEKHHGEARSAGLYRCRRSGSAASSGCLLSRDVEAIARSAAVSGIAGPRASGDDRPLSTGLRQPHARLSIAGEEPQGRGRDARAFADARRAARFGARALQRLHRDSHLLALRRRPRHVRPQDHSRIARGHAAAPLLAGPAPRRVERAGARKLEGDHPVRIADRRADVLVRRFPKCHGQLRSRRIHRRPQSRFPKTRHPQRLDCL